MARAKKKQKQRRNLIIVSVTVGAVLFAIAARYLYVTPIPVLQPAGPIAAGQLKLLITACLLMLPVVVPVFVLTFGIAWRYRESNHNKAKYEPNLDGSRVLEAIWWLVPSALIAVIAVMTWHGTYKYDPYRPLASKADTLTIQAVALDWRWLFIYPDQQVASVNELYMPVSMPVKFEITADAPMNSFWIPQLGGQIYAMPGMSTTLHLKADRTGIYYGSAANISGAGFADMHFKAVALKQPAFKAWVKNASDREPLSLQTYNQLAKPSRNRSIHYYGRPAPGLYDTIISKYMNMDNETHDHKSMEGM